MNSELFSGPIEYRFGAYKDSILPSHIQLASHIRIRTEFPFRHPSLVHQSLKIETDLPAVSVKNAKKVNQEKSGDHEDFFNYARNGCR